MSEHDDPLWNPCLPADPALRRLESLLAPYSARTRGLQARLPRLPRPARRRWPLALAASLLLVCTAGYLLHAHRLHWDTGRAWAMRDGAGASLAPGEYLETGAGERVELRVARIGQLTLSPGSRLGLLATGPGRHRVNLERGHLRARIWAPPGYFGVHSGAAEIIDLGCDFDLFVAADRAGRVVVRSGWIVYRIGGHEQLVPAGHVLRFDAERPGTPLREDAPKAVRELVGRFDQLLGVASPESEAVHEVAEALAGQARDADAFTLLSMLSRRPDLAAGPLYPRLAAALGVPVDDADHRQRWAAGEVAPRVAWWARLPTQPKQWWRNWRDVLRT